jgi:lysophospholipase L1-like esterase
MNVRSLSSAVLFLALLAGPARAEMLHLGTLGDSLTDPYANYTGSLNPQTGLPFWGSGGDKNWVEQFQALRSGQISIFNQAHAGATSADLLAQGQHTAVAAQIQAGNVQHAALIVGANDVLAYLGGNPAPLNNLGANLRTALDALKAAGQVSVVLGNVPNLAVTPVLQGLYTPAQLAGVTAAVQAANTQIAAVAHERGLPVVDLYALSGVAQGPLTFGGTTLSPLQLFTPDLFHPSTILQGLLADSYLAAEHLAYGTDVAGLRLSDQDILTLAHVSHQAGATFFDVSPFVQFETAAAAPEPSGLVLAGTAVVCSLGYWGRRRQRSATAC